MDEDRSFIIAEDSLTFPWNGEKASIDAIDDWRKATIYVALTRPRLCRRCCDTAETCPPRPGICWSARCSTPRIRSPPCRRTGRPRSPSPAPWRCRPLQIVERKIRQIRFRNLERSESASGEKREFISWRDNRRGSFPMQRNWPCYRDEIKSFLFSATIRFGGRRRKIFFIFASIPVNKTLRKSISPLAI